ncbi:MAG: hypothetical protein AAB724_00645, partial [Patescibacteria group bacterium]
VGSELGLLQLRGYVSKEKTNNFKLFNNTKTEGAFIVQVIGLGSGQGASGGGVFSAKRGEIVGIMTASVSNPKGHDSIVVSSIIRFNNFYKEYTEGKRPLIKK